MTDREINIDMCADNCKACIISLIEEYGIDIGDDMIVLSKVKKWIDYVTEE